MGISYVVISAIMFLISYAITNKINDKVIKHLIAYSFGALALMLGIMI